MVLLVGIDKKNVLIFYKLNYDSVKPQQEQKF